mgnify:FL=1
MRNVASHIKSRMVALCNSLPKKDEVDPFLHKQIFVGTIVSMWLATEPLIFNRMTMFRRGNFFKNKP